MGILSMYELAGLILTGIAAAVTYFKSRNRKSDLLLVSVLGGFLTLLIGIRFDAIPAIRGTIRDLHPLSAQLQTDTRVSDLTKQLLRASSVATASEEPMVEGLLNIRFSDLRAYLDNFSNERFRIQEHDLPRFAMELIENAQISYHASSYVRHDEWWNQSWGERYGQLNIDAKERGVEVVRTFIFSSSDLDEEIIESAIEHMTTQYRAGIAVYAVSTGQLPAD